MRINLNLDNINYNTRPDRSSYRAKAERIVNDLFSCEEEFNGWVTWPLDGAREILPAIENEASRIRELCDVLVFCKCKFLKFADKNGEFCISVLEKVAGCPAGLPDAS